MQELANKIPELRELAYNKYQDDIANERADLATYMDLSNQAYDRYSKDRDLAYNENVLMNEYGYANTQNQNNLKIQDWQNRQSVENGNVDIRNNAAIQNWQNQQNISNANIDAANALIKYNNQLLNSSNEANTKLYNSAQEALYNQQMAEYDASQNYWKKLDDLVIGNKTSGSGERAQIYVDGLGWLSSKELDQYIKDDRISEESRGNVIYYKAIKQGSR